MNEATNLDISITLPWLTILTAAVTVLSWYVKTKLREGLEKGFEKMSQLFVSKTHLGYVEGMLKQEIENKFSAVALELKHISNALRDMKDELKAIRDKQGTKFS